MGGSDNKNEIFISKNEIKDLIKEAIVAERGRIASIIYMSSAHYDHDYETGEDYFDWGTTVIELANSIRKSDE